MITRFDNLFRGSIQLRIVLALLILASTFLTGTLGYHFIEKMTYFDSLYMTFITITTIGFGEIHPLSESGRILTILISIFGIGTIAYIASQTAQLLFENKQLFQRVIQRRIAKMEDHFIICGYGRIGRRIAQVLFEAGVEVVVIDNRSGPLETLHDDRMLFVEGNAQDEEILSKAGIKKARGLVCTLSKDEDNIFVTLIARELNENLFILARSNQQKNNRKILRAGADKVISPYEIGADRMANVILRPNVDHFMNRLVSHSGEDHYFDEIKIGPQSSITGKTISEAGIRQRYNLVIIAVIPEGTGEIQFNPGSSYRLGEYDTLIVLGDEERIGKMRTEVCGDNRTLADRVRDYKPENIT